MLFLFYVNKINTDFLRNILFYFISAAPPPGPSTSGGSVGTAGVAASSVAAPSNMGLVPAQQAHTPPQPTELPSEYI